MVLSGQHHIVVRVRGSYRARVRVDCLQHRAVESARDGKVMAFPWIHHGAIEGGMRLVSSTMKEGMHADPSWNHAQAVHHHARILAPARRSLSHPPFILGSFRLASVRPSILSLGLTPCGPLPPSVFPPLGLSSRPPAFQVFAPGQMRGHWRVSYSDEDMRVLTTNKGSLFVLGRIA